MASLPRFFGIPGAEKHGLTIRGLGETPRIRDRGSQSFEEAVLAR